MGVIRPPMLAEKGIASVRPLRKEWPAGTKASSEAVSVIIMAVVAMLLIHMPKMVVHTITPISDSSHAQMLYCFVYYNLCASTLLTV